MAIPNRARRLTPEVSSRELKHSKIASRAGLSSDLSYRGVCVAVRGFGSENPLCTDWGTMQVGSLLKATDLFMFAIVVGETRTIFIAFESDVLN